GASGRNRTSMLPLSGFDLPGRQAVVAALSAIHVESRSRDLYRDAGPALRASIAEAVTRFDCQGAAPSDVTAAIVVLGDLAGVVGVFNHGLQTLVGTGQS